MNLQLDSDLVISYFILQLSLEEKEKRKRKTNLQKKICVVTLGVSLSLGHLYLTISDPLLGPCLSLGHLYLTISDPLLESQ